MSGQDNLELVRRAFDAFNRRDADALLDCFHAESEWRPAISPGGMEGRTYNGHDGLREWLAEVAESWETFEARDFSARPAGETVVVLGYIHARGRASGVEIDRELAQVWEMEDGKALRATAYATHTEALEAAGLSE